MSAPESIVHQSPPELKDALRAHLFRAEIGLGTFAVLDGASIPDLLDRLYNDQPEFVCLYRGELEPDLAEVAPYLVRLDADQPFTEWVLTQGWGQHWGIFALSPGNLTALRKHFRTFLVVRNPEGKQLYFRYYDPRVLRIYLPTCNTEETELIFGPITAYLCEDEKPEMLISFRAESGLPRGESIPLPVAVET